MHSKPKCKLHAKLKCKLHAKPKCKLHVKPKCKFHAKPKCKLFSVISPLIEELYGEQKCFYFFLRFIFVKGWRRKHTHTKNSTLDISKPVFSSFFRVFSIFALPARLIKRCLPRRFVICPSPIIFLDIYSYILGLKSKIEKLLNCVNIKDVIRKVISEVYTFVVLCCVHMLCTPGGNENTRRNSKPDMGSIFQIKKLLKYSGLRKLLCELSKLSKFNAFNLLGY